MGSGWNMASNMIHFIDLYQFFSGEINDEIVFKFNKENRLIKSKRKEFKELKGKIYVYNSKGCILTFEDSKSFNDQLIIKIHNKKKVIEVNESKYLAKINKKIFNFKYPYQSYLSQFYPRHLIKSKKLGLSDISESYLGHELLFRVLGAQLNKIYKKKLSSFPIS